MLLPQGRLSFVDIVRMVEEGKTPPGIKAVADAVSRDAPSLMAAAAALPPKKPWEASAAGPDPVGVSLPAASPTGALLDRVSGAHSPTAMPAGVPPVVKAPDSAEDSGAVVASGGGTDAPPGTAEAPNDDAPAEKP
jgi:hypothetical protein